MLSVPDEAECASAGEELRAVSREPIAPGTPVMAYNHPVSQDGSQKYRELGGTEELRHLRLSKRLPGPPGAIGGCSGGDSTLCVFVKVRESPPQAHSLEPMRQGVGFPRETRIINICTASGQEFAGLCRASITISRIDPIEVSSKRTPVRAIRT